MLRYIDYMATWVGIPYVHQGHTRQGVDCIGLVRAAYGELGVDLSQYDVPDRPWTPHPRQLIRGLDAAFIRQTGTHCFMGSVACLRDITGQNYHCGLVYPLRGQILTLEADRARGRVIQRVVSPSAVLNLWAPTEEQYRVIAANLVG